MTSFIKPLEKKNKRAMSAVVGYVLLITFGIIMSTIVYSYLKTYVPKDISSCSDGTSIFLESYSCSAGNLNITLKNNGKFNYVGYSIHASNDPNQSVAGLNLNGNITGSSEGSYSSSPGYVIFDNGRSNFMIPQKQVTHYFSYGGNLRLLEITPVVLQKEGSSVKFVQCGNAIIRQEVDCLP